MIGAAPQSGSLAALIATERDAVKTFVKLLEEEQESLLHGEVERLMGYAERKSSLLLKLRQLGTNRNQFLASQGLPGDRVGVDAWFARRPDAALERQWLELLRLADNARQMNNTNGIIIRARLRQNQQALATLGNAAHAMSLYGPDGGARLSAAGRRFGAA